MIKVFVFEDSWMCREALVAVLGQEPGLCVVGAAATVAEGLAALASAQPDVVLMDLRFDQESQGIQATREVKARLPGAQVIIFTDFPQDADLEEAIRAGASGFLLKQEVQDPAVLVTAIQVVQRGEVYLAPGLATQAVRRLQGLRQGRFGLSPRELETLGLIADGLENKEIARHLGIAERTVANHVGHILAKLQARNRTEAVAIARKHGLIED